MWKERKKKMAEAAAESGEKAAVGASPAPVCFSFTRTTGRRRLLAVTGQDGGEEKLETDFLRAVEGRELQSARPAAQPEDLAIALIQKDRWKKAADPAALQDLDGTNGVEAQAVRELVEASKKSQEHWESGSKIDPAFAIPLLRQHRGPDGYGDGEKMDLRFCPESSTEADYKAVPVEAYGVAMLKGMGWKAGEGIGRTFKQQVKPLENRLRPKGLGLGADRSAAQDLQPSRPQRPPKPGEEPLGLVTGGAVYIEAGPHKELYGKIGGTDADNARLMVKLAIGGKTVTVSQHGVRPVTQKEYDKSAKDLSRLRKAHKEEEAGQRNGAQGDLERRAAPDRKEKRSKKRKQAPKAERDERSGKHCKTGVSGHSSSRGAPHWLWQNLRVRFVDKLFKGGKYYNTKMVIEDVLKPDVCVCRTEEGQILDGIQESMLETVIPRGDADWVMVVLGERAGQVGRILRRNKDQGCVLVQLQREEEKLQTLDYDAVCHYVGGSEDD